MARCITTLSNLGEQASWLLVQQVLGMPDAKMQSDYMKDKVAMLLFTRQSLPERLCVTAAVRQMSGTTIYAGDQSNWQDEMRYFHKELIPVFGYYFDCLYTYGFPVEESPLDVCDLRFPVINAGSPDAHPAHVLSDLACMLKSCPDLSQVTAAWIGCCNGTLRSLMDSTKWFHFRLRIAMPAGCNRDELRQKAVSLGTDIEFCDTAQEAARGVNFIYAGYRGECNETETGQWSVTPQLMAMADRDARLLLSASPVRAIAISPEVLHGKTSLLHRQAEYRLRLHKRILHWVFE